MRLFFIRHGETTGDVENRYGGAYDDVLSPCGEQQVLRLAEELKSKNIEKVFSSPLTRAKQTAQGIADTIDCPVIVMDDLRERNQYGRLSGMMKEEALQRYPDWVEMLKDRLNTIPDAESYDAARQRTAAAYGAVLSQAEKCFAIVWHGGGMRILFRDILKLGELKKIGDCCWVELRQKKSHGPFTLANSKRIEMDFLKGDLTR